MRSFRRSRDNSAADADDLSGDVIWRNHSSSDRKNLTTGTEIDLRSRVLRATVRCFLDYRNQICARVARNVLKFCFDIFLLDYVG